MPSKEEHARRKGQLPPGPVPGSFGRSDHSLQTRRPAGPPLTETLAATAHPELLPTGLDKMRFFSRANMNKNAEPRRGSGPCLHESDATHGPAVFTELLCCRTRGVVGPNSPIAFWRCQRSRAGSSKERRNVCTTTREKHARRQNTGRKTRLGRSACCASMDPNRTKRLGVSFAQGRSKPSHASEHVEIVHKHLLSKL